MKYLKEAAAFEKLILPLETSQQTESLAVEENISLKVPDNNPFKIGKAKEVLSDLRMNVTEDASVLTYVEKTETATMRNEQSAEGEQNVMLLDEKEDSDVGDCKCLVTVSLESRESLSSRPKRAATNSKQSQGGDKQKRRKIKSSESTRNSILNYFFFR